MAPPIDLKTELLINAVWTDVTGYTLYADEQAGATVSRGQADESPQATASSLDLLLDNRDGRFSNRNPLGAYYPNLTQNTQVRVSVPEGASYLRCEFTGFDFSAAPDTAGVSITGDTEIQVDVTLDNWNANQALCSKWTASGGQRSWILLLNEDGTLTFRWSSDGTTGASSTATSTIAVPVPALHRQAIKVTLATGTGTVIFYTAPAAVNQVLSGPITAGWVQLGSPVVLGARTVFDSTASLRAGAPGTGFSTDYPLHAGIYGKIHSFKLLSGIGGTVKASPDFTAATAGASSFADAQSNTWTNQQSAEISNRRYRFHGEIPSWPQRFDQTATMIWTTVTGNGLLRRLGQSSKPLGSALTRYWKKLTGSTAPVAYWPCEDLTRATAFASGLPGGLPMAITKGRPRFAADTSFLCSNALPVCNNGGWYGPVPDYTIGTDHQVIALISIPSGGDTDGAAVLGIQGSGSVALITLTYNTASSGTLTMNCWAGDGLQLDTVPVAYTGVNGTQLAVRIAVAAPIAGSSTVRFDILPPGGTITAGSDTVTAASLGRIQGVTVNWPKNISTTNGIAVGQIAVQNVAYLLSNWNGQVQAVNAWQGEPAGTRFSRLCSEEAIGFRGQGQLSVSSPMGAQLPATLLSLLQDCADADRGVMFEPRQAALALGYRTRASLYNQSPGVTLDFSQATLSDLEPTDDDQNTLNDVTVQRSGGSSARVAVTTGPKSTAAPPGGVGIYDTSMTLNVWADSQARDEAGWMVHLGTVDEARYPLIGLNLRRSQLTGVFYDLQDMDIGDYLSVTNMPGTLTYDGIRQILKQQAERLGGFSYETDWACAPEVPYEVLQFDDAVHGRFDADNSTLASGATSTATSLSVASATATPLWTTSYADAFSFGAQGTPADGTYFIASNADTNSYLKVGNYVQDTKNAGVLFLITAIDPPFAGFNNIHVSPTASVIMSSVDTITGPAGDFPFDVVIAGERIAVGKITGASSPQTFTVKRSVNGVVKAQNSGAAVALFQTPTYAM
jgi:hypothetical protein